MPLSALIIAAHPDDEVLGVGGTAARLATEGWQVSSLIVAEGATARQTMKTGSDPNELSTVAKLTREAEQAARELGLPAPRRLGLPDNRLDGMDLLDVIQAIESIIEEARPDTVFTHHGADLNMDHRLVHQAVLTACRPLPGAPTRNILAFETVSSTEWAVTERVFQPNYFVDISNTLPRKIAALNCYGGEMRPFPHPRSIQTIEHLAHLRGSQCGLIAAEAFEVVRQVR